MGDDDLDGVLRRVELLTDGDRHREALQLITPALAAHPDDPRAHLAASLAHLGIDGGAAAALHHGQEAARLFPDGEHAYRLQALAYLKLRRSREARRVARRAVELQPGIWQTHLVYGHTLLEDPVAQGQARLAAAEATRLAPQVPSVHLLSARALLDSRMHLTKEDRKAAEQHIQEALRIDPNHSVALHELARVRLRARRPLEAMSVLRDALRIDPQQSESVRGLSAVFGVWVWRAHLVLWVAGSLFVLPGAGRGSPGPGLVAALVAVTVCSWMLIRVRGAMGGRLSTVLRAVWHRDKLLAAWTALLVPVAVAYVVATLAPTEIAERIVPWALGSLLVGVVLSWLRAWRN